MNYAHEIVTQDCVYRITHPVVAAFPIGSLNRVFSGLPCIRPFVTRTANGEIAIISANCIDTPAAEIEHHINQNKVWGIEGDNPYDDLLKTEIVFSIFAGERRHNYRVPSRTKLKEPAQLLREFILHDDSKNFDKPRN